MLEEGRSGERERVRAGLLPLGSDSRWGLRPRAGPISKRELADPLGFAASLRDSRRAVSAPPSPPSMSAECLACWQKPLFRSKTLREAAVVASMSSWLQVAERLPSILYFLFLSYLRAETKFKCEKKTWKGHPLHAARGTDVSSPARPAGARAMACGRRDVHAVLCSCMHAHTTPQAPSTCCSGACCSFGVRPHHGTGVNGFGRRQDGREPGSSHTGSAHR